MAKKSIYTKKLGLIVAGAAQPAATGKYHVISGLSQKWTVVSDGRVRPVKVFATQRAAVDFAKKKAAKITGIVIVHTKAGQISDTISYATA
jgi:Uncharacterized protein conserved in bacteria (DUF2188)